MVDRLPSGVEIKGEITPEFAEILTHGALALVARLHRSFEYRRQEMLAQREQIAKQFDLGLRPDFLKYTASIREADWKIGKLPKDLQCRRVEITGPVERKMVINALNSGADSFMADFEDSNTPNWHNQIQGQINMRDAIRGTIELNQNGKIYKLKDKVATLLVRPRGWHLDEKHVLVNGRRVSGGIFDMALYLYHNANALLAKGSGPYFYLPKIESHQEARLWNDIMSMAEAELGLARGTIKATVLIETITAAFEMDEILYELREHSAGLNAGRWDYMFSVIKTHRTSGRDFVLPERNSVTMTVPFMRAYTELLVKSCHKRGASAIGGMAAFIPSSDPAVNEVAFAKVQADKSREANDGFDGSWVAHPGMVELCKSEFTKVLGERPNQIDRKRDEVEVSASDLLNVRRPQEWSLRPGFEITSASLFNI